MKPKIGVMGAASGKHSKELLEKAAVVGKAIAKNNCIMLYGATIGLPLQAARAAKNAGGLVLGVSPGANEKEHREKYGYPTDACSAVIYTGFGFQGRNVILGRSSDAIIIISGRIGTLSEFAIAYAESKVIGVLTGSGGIADEIAKLEEILAGEMPAKIIYDSNPAKLVENVVKELK